MNEKKYILISGGVISGLGKGTVTSSIGALLKACGIQVTCIKIDPYLNVDAGLLNPNEHGECFVLDDGGEADLDLGNYERALDINLTRDNNITTGKIYLKVINDERRGLYGRTIQIIPHITDAIQTWIENIPCESMCLIELGGTIGDIEAMPFVEALRQFEQKVGKKNFFHIHVSFVPSVTPDGEGKTKPTQFSVAELGRGRLNPDMIILRSYKGVTTEVKRKVAFYSKVELDRVCDLPNLNSLYDVPLHLKSQRVLAQIAEQLNLNCSFDDASLNQLLKLSQIASSKADTITIALVGKYADYPDNYHSVFKALEHACYGRSKKPNIKLINSFLLEPKETQDDKTKDAWQLLKTADCLLVPGGFGARGSEGKINAIKYARENKIPFLGICFGFQLAVVEYARNMLGVSDATSGEFLDEPNSKRSYIIEMLDYKEKADGKLGGTMRLGRKRTVIVRDGSILESYYGSKNVDERHRHRYEVNPAHINELEAAGLRFVGKNEDGTRMEILELSTNVHPYFVAVQYHPEYLSRPNKPSPTYLSFIDAALKQKSDESR